MSITNPKAIVAMSVYINDKTEYLQKSIDSILQQTFDNFLFYIVIDGPIPEPLSDILKMYQDKRLVILKNNENKGLAYSLNKIISNVLQDDNICPTYFFRMDADDISDLSRFSKQIQFFESNKGISVLGTDCFEIDEHGHIIGKRQMPLFHKTIIRKMPRHCPINHPSVAIRFSIFEQGFAYDASLMNTQDYYLWIELAAAGVKFRNLPDKLLYFRRSSNFYQRRGKDKAINDHNARAIARKKLNLNTPLNFSYAYAVLIIRQCPSWIILSAYKFLEIKRKLQRLFS